MTWHPPLNPLTMTLLVAAALAVMVGSYFWSRRQLTVLDPQGLLTALLRGAAFVLLLFFVMQPTRLPAPHEVTVPKTLAVLIDTSGSMSQSATATGGGATRLDEGRRMIAQYDLSEQITRQAQLALYGFDRQAAPLKTQALRELEAKGRQTDLAAAIAHVVDLHTEDDLVGLVVFTDGRNTQGDDPRQAARKHNTPLYLVGIGQAAQREAPVEQVRYDLAVDSVVADPRIILGRSGQVVASVSASGYPARQVTVELLVNERVIGASAVAVSPQQARRQALFAIRPDSVGTHRYQIRVPVEDDEADRTNNLRTFDVEVVDPVNRLLYIDRLRDERRFLKLVLERRRNLLFTTVMQLNNKRHLIQGNDPAMHRQAAQFNAEQLSALKAIVIGDLPADVLNAEQIARLTRWVDRGGALLVLAGPSSIGAGGFAATMLADLLPVTLPDPMRYREQEFGVSLTAEGAAHPAFQRVRGRWADVPSLLSRFEIAAMKPAATALIATTDQAGAPVVVTRRYGHGKVTIVLTDSTWRWQLAHAAADPAASPHGLFWNQMIDWLLPELDSTEAEASQVQLISDRLEYEVGEPIMLMVSVRKADGTMMTDATVRITAAAPDDRPIERRAVLQAADDPSVPAAFAASFDPHVPGRYAVQAVAEKGGKTIVVVQKGDVHNTTCPDGKKETYTSAQGLAWNKCVGLLCP